MYAAEEPSSRQVNPHPSPASLLPSSQSSLLSMPPLPQQFTFGVLGSLSQSPVPVCKQVCALHPGGNCGSLTFIFSHVSPDSRIAFPQTDATDALDPVW